MGTDTDDIRPRTWDQIRRRQEARVESKRTQVVIKERTERQKMLDRELGFKVVEKPEPKPKQEAHQKEEKAADSNEVVERLLQVFFRNNNGGSAARQKVSAPVETKNEKANAGGKVVMKGEISNKTW
ncbi:hypothetical protein AGDE_07259 [Angomonas deanei]|uniref:Uncharacterized protein n=1 Tax=Angomonas deanei TaxID=59799 RepID=A0A7G2CC54_9TRYP|nr:hypothetical protein AGDE_07259 [Angomonas deanei]CAD2216527.1 hypothetical protein, conserved [Angomonas deanei]|eukprot:EPY35746.1 hypothetical protein AGDE_07259 [Angomonas deanei]